MKCFKPRIATTKVSETYLPYYRPQLRNPSPTNKHTHTYIQTLYVCGGGVTNVHQDMFCIFVFVSIYMCVCVCVCVCCVFVCVYLKI